MNDGPLTYFSTPLKMKAAFVFKYNLEANTTTMTS
jgi:hypothetical protein